MFNFAFDALLQMRISHHWDAINEETDAKENVKLDNRDYIPKFFEHGDTRKHCQVKYSRHRPIS
jgi:hypothetical protein